MEIPVDDGREKRDPHFSSGRLSVGSAGARRVPGRLWRAAGYPVLDADIARLSPYMRRHINFHGHYSFAPTDLGGARRALRDPDAPDDG
jgi:hypothetical protein